MAVQKTSAKPSSASPVLLSIFALPSYPLSHSVPQRLHLPRGARRMNALDD